MKRSKEEEKREGKNGGSVLFPHCTKEDRKSGREERGKTQAGDFEHSSGRRLCAEKRGGASNVREKEKGERQGKRTSLSYIIFVIFFPRIDEKLEKKERQEEGGPAAALSGLLKPSGIEKKKGRRSRDKKKRNRRGKKGGKDLALIFSSSSGPLTRRKGEGKKEKREAECT